MYVRVHRDLPNTRCTISTWSWSGCRGGKSSQKHQPTSFYAFLHISIYANEESIMGMSYPSFRLSTCSFSSTTGPVWIKFRGTITLDTGTSQFRFHLRILPPRWLQAALSLLLQAHRFDPAFLFLHFFFFFWLPTSFSLLKMLCCLKNGNFCRSYPLSPICGPRKRRFYSSSPCDILFIYLFTTGTFSQPH